MHRKHLSLLFLIVFLLGGRLFGQQPSQTHENQTPAEQPSGAAIGDTNSEVGRAGSGAVAAGSAGSPSQGISLPRYFYKHLTGEIGGTYRIVMDLTRMGNRLLGDYYYADRGIPLFFQYDSTITKDGRIHLVETDPLGASGAGSSAVEPSTSETGPVTGVFDGRFVGQNELRGTWRKSVSSSPLSFALSTAGVQGGAFDMEHDKRSYFDRSRGNATMEVTFPVMRTDSAETDAAVNANVLSTILDLYENGASTVPPTSVAEAMGDFIRSFTLQLGEPSPRTGFPPWTYSITARILFNADGILSIRYEAFSFEGGAHPTTIYRNSSYLRATGSILTLGDLFEPGFQKRLDVLGLKEFRREHGIKAGQGLKDAGYFVSDRDFHLNRNFTITRAGLLFQFNQYEIAPYYYGAQQVLIPYADLRALISPGSPIAPLAAQSAETGGPPQG